MEAQTGDRVAQERRRAQVESPCGSSQRQNVSSQGQSAAFRRQNPPVQEQSVRSQRRGGRAGILVACIAVVAIVAIVVGGLVLYKVRFNPVSRQLALGQRYLLEEDYEQAVIAFNKVIELDSRCVDAYDGLMDAYLSQGDVDAAYNCYMAVRDVDDLSQEEIESAFADHLDRLESALNDLTEDTDDVEEQIRLTDMLVALWPDAEEYSERQAALAAAEDMDSDEAEENDAAAEGADSEDPEDDTLAEDRLDYADLEGIQFQMASGVGAWATLLEIASDGSFTGEYHDFNMGDMAPEHPNGDCYYSEFSGRFGALERVDEYTYVTHIEELNYLLEGGTEEIKDGILYYYEEMAYGLDDATDIYIYLPGRSMADVEYASGWIYGGIDSDTQTLTAYAIDNVAQQLMFAGSRH